MARVISIPSGVFVGPFEPRVVDQLGKELPGDYTLIPNFQLKQKDRDAFEFDIVVLAPHAIYVVEEKEWYGRVTGDDQEWLLNQTPKKCPLWLANTKCKVLKSELQAYGNQVYVAPLLVVPDSLQVQVGGNWRDHVVHLNSTAKWIRDAKRLGNRVSDVKRNFAYIEKSLLGRIVARKRESRRRVGGYEIIETLFADNTSGEYVARRAHVEDTARVRVRTWRLDRSGTPQLVEKRIARIKRPTEAVAKIGRHPNLLPVLHFDFLDDENEFFEVTEWTEYGTLHGHLNNSQRAQLTLRERLQIAAGIASALREVHAHGLVHRNVCPEAIVIGFDHQPRLTDFDRAYIEGGVTVFEETAHRGNAAFVAPELENLFSYDFDAASDMYSFGAVLYQLLTGRTAFASPTEARAAGGRPAKLPSEVRDGIDPRLDSLVIELLRIEDMQRRPSAEQALDLLSNILGPTTTVPPTGTSLRIEIPGRFEPGSIVDGVWRIDAPLGQGAFSRVYRVFHLDHQKTYAMKVLSNVRDTDLPANEWRDASKLPPHPNVAKVIWMDRLAPPEQTPYVLYEFIDGETIEPYADGRKRLAWPDIKRIGLELLSALQAVHGAGIVHRDIKPANVLLELPAHRTKLIDFNIVGTLGDTAGAVGTPRYRAPDAGKPAWGVQEDLFSLGVVLYELVLQRHPYPRDAVEAGAPYAPNDISPDAEKLSEELGSFLFKGVQPKRGDRFQSAAEMYNALEAIDLMYAPTPTPTTTSKSLRIALSADEIARQNYNPYVTRLLTLYSQARQTNAGTRGLDEIAQITYVPTRLDEKLAPAIVSGNYRLVIVTGNAGDGKTAFLQQVQKAFGGKAVVTPLESGNGSTWTHNGVHYETNYDGSQDEGDNVSDEVLARFFRPFRGEMLGGLDAKTARLIAINEGRLLDFLAHSKHSAEFGGLSRFVHSALASKDQPDRALLVNLNVRAVTAGGDNSLVEKQLLKILDTELWRSCQDCGHRLRCPIKHNVDTLSDPVSGPETRRRMRRLFEIVHLRRRAHITMRDLRSALSWMILRDHGCEDIARLLSRTDSNLAEALASLYYSEAFADQEAHAIRHTRTRPELQDERAVDRLVRRLRECDVGLVNSPQLDRRLNHSPETAVPWMTFERRSGEGRKVLREVWSSAPLPGPNVPLEGLLNGRRRMIAQLRRWAFFERRDAGWEQQIPYKASQTLEAIIDLPEGPERDAACELLRDAVVDAMSLSEGLRSSAVSKKYLALKTTRIKNSKIRSYRLFPKESFKVLVPVPVRQTDFIEYAPDVVELVSESGEGHARLRISLDLLEMLELIRSGYRPTTADLQGLFVNFLIFRNELLATHFEKLLVTKGDDQFFEIEARGNLDGIHLAISPHDVSSLQVVQS